MASKYLDMVTKMTSFGFEKVSVINKSFQVVGASAQDAVPNAWMRTVDEYDDKTGAKTGTKSVQINENQELADTWATKKQFCFFKQAYKVQYKGEKKKMTVNGKDEEVVPVLAGLSEDRKTLIVAKVMSDCWLIAQATKAGGLDLSAKGKKGKKGKGKKKGFSEVKTMIGNNDVSSYFDELDEEDE